MSSSSAIDIVSTPSGSNEEQTPYFDHSITKILSKITIGNQGKPINIDKSLVTANCDYKCVLNFHYPQTSLVVKNKGTELDFNCEETSPPPVSYNNNKMNATRFILYAPSLHLFNGSKVAGEIIIEHVPVLGGKSLYICIPLTSLSAGTSLASIAVSGLIAQAAKGAPASGDTANLNLSNFTLQAIVPKKPFYTYYGENSRFTGDFVVFDKADAISLGPLILQQLTSIIQPLNLRMTGGKLFYNPKGPNQIDNEIYISCHPTGASKEKVKTDTSSSSSSSTTDYDWSSIYNSQGFIIFMVCLGMIIVLYMVNSFFTSMSSGPNGEKVKPSSFGRFFSRSSTSASPKT